MNYRKEDVAEQFVKTTLQHPVTTTDDLQALKRAFARDGRQNGLLPDSRLLAAYRDLVQAGQIAEKPTFERLLMRRPARTVSGVAPVAVSTMPGGCPYRCVYCPTEAGMPKSYLSNEPGMLRATRNTFDARGQVESRLRTLSEIGHTTDKVDLIILGGTFTTYPPDYQTAFVRDCFDACNGVDSTSLTEAHTRNESARHRIVGLSIETRPDEIDEDAICELRRLGVTRIELGVQTLYDDVLQLVRRGHSVADTAVATQLLKDAGFKICYHMMPNLPGSDPERDVEMFRTLFSDPRFFPDMLKIYPCVVVRDAALHDWWRDGRYTPYDDETLAELLMRIKQQVPPFVRINRVVRDFPAGSIVAGTRRSDMRREAQRWMRERGLACRCIRCREIRDRAFRAGKPQLVVREYQASGGMEYFLSFEDEAGALYGLLRLRIPSQLISGQRHFNPELEGAAIIREVHTYGMSLGVGETPAWETQHRGLGRRLVRQAERLARDMGIEKVAVIAGVGVRGYFRKLGYRLGGTYMTKWISQHTLAGTMKHENS
ncbi:MAG: elongator complex protein 3 [Anaerolineae bacterium]